MFKRPQDMRYIAFLRRLHSKILFDWYLEIGCRSGTSLEAVRGKTIGIDPFFKIERNVIGTKPALHIFQQTSDDFFDSGFLQSLGARLGFAFIDGMHLIEFALRDFINVEKNSVENGVIALHDCCPYSFEMTTRNLEDLPTGAWTGDVWKIIPILREFRPDLKLTVLGCRPTGLVLVSNLDPTNEKLTTKYDEILAEWRDLSLEEFGAATFYDQFEYTQVSEIVQGGFALFDKVKLHPSELRVPQYITP